MNVRETIHYRRNEFCILSALEIQCYSDHLRLIFNLRGINIIQMMFRNDINFDKFIITNFWIDNSSFIMQDSGQSDVIIGFNWACNSQLSIHIDFTTLNCFHFIILADTLSLRTPTHGISRTRT